MSDMSLAERHARIRAHEDLDAFAALNQVITEHFGGDIDRTIWFLQECSLMSGGRTPTVFSVRTGSHLNFYSIKGN